MRFLIDSHSYFEGRASIPFVPGLVAVLMTAGLDFFTSVVGLAWAESVRESGSGSSLSGVSVETFAYPFFSVFVAWFGLAALFYLFTLLNGTIRVRYLTQLNIVGLGFVPLVAVSAIEFTLTSYYALTVSVATAPGSTMVLRAGGFGILPVVGITVTSLVFLLWSGHVWNGGIHQLGGVSPRQSTTFSLIVVAMVFVTRVGVSVT